MPSVLSHARVITEASDLLSKVQSIIQHCPAPFPSNLLYVMFFVFIFVAILVTPAMKPEHPIFYLSLAIVSHI